MRSRAMNSLRSRIPDGETEHAVEMMDAVGTILLERMDDRFGIAVRPKDVSRVLERGPHRLKIVDLAIEHDPPLARLVAQRLMTAGEIDDAQATHADRRATIVVEPVVVGSPMHDRRRHRLEHASKIFVRRATNTYDSTHGPVGSSSSRKRRKRIEQNL